MGLAGQGCAMLQAAKSLQSSGHCWLHRGLDGRRWAREPQCWGSPTSAGFEATVTPFKDIKVGHIPAFPALPPCAPVWVARQEQSPAGRGQMRDPRPAALVPGVSRSPTPRGAQQQPWAQLLLLLRARGSPHGCTGIPRGGGGRAAWGEPSPTAGSSPLSLPSTHIWRQCVQGVQAVAEAPPCSHPVDELPVAPSHSIPSPMHRPGWAAPAAPAPLPPSPGGGVSS